MRHSKNMLPVETDRSLSQHSSPDHPGILRAAWLAALLLTTAVPVAQSPYLVEDIMPGFQSSFPIPLGSPSDGHMWVLASGPDDASFFGTGGAIFRTDGTAGELSKVGSVPGLCRGEYFQVPRVIELANGGVLVGNYKISPGQAPRIIPGTCGNLVPAWRPKCYSCAPVPKGPVPNVQDLFFVANSPEHGKELGIVGCRTSGGVQVIPCEKVGKLYADIRPGPVGSDPRDLTPFHGELYFTAREGLLERRQIWRTGRGGVNQLVLPGAYSSAQGPLFVFRNWLYFHGSSSAGYGLYRYHPNSQIHPEPPPQFVATVGDMYYVTEVGDCFFFAVWGEGSELWVSDGTPGGTRLVKVFGEWSRRLKLSGLAAMGDELLFYADDDVTGFELWKSDGTEAGTQLVKDINPGPESSGPREKIVVPGQGRTGWFIADDGQHGHELWKTDGTEAGTQLVMDIYPGRDSAFFLGGGDAVGGYLREAGGKIYFSAYDDQHGFELWAVDVGAVTTPVGTGCSDGTRSLTLTGTDPVLGGLLKLSGSGAAAGSVGVLVLAEGPPSPFSWGFGCTSYPDLTAYLNSLPFPRPDNGSWSFEFQVPDDPGLLGLQVTFQVAFLGTDAPLGLDMTNGVLCTVGY